MLTVTRNTRNEKRKNNYIFHSGKQTSSNHYHNKRKHCLAAYFARLEHQINGGIRDICYIPYLYFRSTRTSVLSNNNHSGYSCIQIEAGRRPLSKILLA